MSDPKRERDEIEGAWKKYEAEELRIQAMDGNMSGFVDPAIRSAFYAGAEAARERAAGIADRCHAEDVSQGRTVSDWGEYADGVVDASCWIAAAIRGEGKQ